MLRFIFSVIVGALAFFILSTIIPSKEEAGIYESTVRLHVIANSDSEEDQNVKLKVRDAIIDHISKYNAKTKDEALSFIDADKENLKKIAEECLKNNGFDYPVSIKIGEESYPTREYEDFTLPAGVYTSLQIVLGEGEGQNWWCVLFPPLCTKPALSYDEDACIDVGLTKDQYNLITGTNGEYKIKFKLLEIASQAFSWTK